MKLLLIPRLAALTLPNAIRANFEPKFHNICKDVKDYMGCFKAKSKIFKLPLLFVPLVVFLELNKLVKPIFEKYQIQHQTFF